MAELKQELVYQQALLRRSRRDLELQRLRQEEEISQAREGLQQMALELQSLAKQRRLWKRSVSSSFQAG